MFLVGFKDVFKLKKEKGEVISNVRESRDGW